jgi:protein gp37
MGLLTKIQWTDHTFNPWRGCTKVSPGCANCYAEKQSHRNPAVLGEWGPDGKRSIASEAYWKQPLAWNRAARAAGERRRVFCASLADVFEQRPDLAAPRSRLFRLIDKTPHLDWLLLTKRPQNIESMWHSQTYADDAGREWGDCVPTRQRFLRKNVWLGTSVEDQERSSRIDQLAASRDLAAVLFLSVEPLLGPLDLATWLDRDLETRGPQGPIWGAFNLAWARALRKQCQHAGVAFFLKQVGEYAATDRQDEGRLLHPRTSLRLVEASRIARGGYVFETFDKKGGDLTEWPEDLQVRELPKVEV